MSMVHFHYMAIPQVKIYGSHCLKYLIRMIKTYVSYILLIFLIYFEF